LAKKEVKVDKAQKIAGEIYQSLVEIQREEEIRMGNKAFIADFLSQKLYKLGYHKLPEGEPPLLSDEEILEATQLGWKKDTDFKDFGYLSGRKQVAQAQRDSDWEWFKGGDDVSNNE